LPSNIVTNDDLSKRVDTSDAWIVERTGIRQRHIAQPGEKTSDLALGAARAALIDAGIDAGELDMIICATTTPDESFPAVATIVQSRLGMAHGAAFDVQAVCSGFIYGLAVADSMIRTGAARTILLIGAETMSRLLDWNDRATCVLFGDGAGAAILRHRGSTHGIISTHIGSDGQYSDILFMPGGGSRCPITRENADLNLATIHMTGKEVYKQAVIAMLDASKKALEKAGLSIHDIACVIPHQANLRIIEAIADRLGISLDKVYVNLDRYGNTSAAAVAMALDEANRTGRIKPGDYVLMVVFGGGLTWASTVIEW
jgi:3-oxoacyl-[acyl-carrier-protein] synthase-3